MSPQGTCAYSCSACRHIRAFSSRSSVAPAAASSSVAVDTSSEALLDSPLPSGTSETANASSGRERDTAALELRDHAAHVVGPGGLARLRRYVERHVAAGVERGAVKMQARPRGSRCRTARDHRVAIDGHGQRETGVVVGVLADQVDPPRRRRQPARCGRRSAPRIHARPRARARQDRSSRRPRTCSSCHPHHFRRRACFPAISTSSKCCRPLIPGTRRCADRPWRGGSRTQRRSSSSNRTPDATRAGTWPWCCPARSNDRASAQRRVGKPRDSVK